MSNPFNLIVVLSVEEESDVDIVSAALAKMRGMCLREPGCLAWDAYQAVDSSEKFFLVERWESREHWEKHGSLSAIQDVYIPVVLPHVKRLVSPVTPVAPFLGGAASIAE